MSRSLAAFVLGGVRLRRGDALGYDHARGGAEAGRMEAVVEDLRAKLRAAASGTTQQDTSESRLEFACAHGSGHVLVTGSDRAAIEALLERVINKTDAIGSVRGNAADPASTVDRLIALLDSESEVTGHLDRRRALLQLLARAQEARKSVFVVVDDADGATIEELERLRTTLEVAPDAIERLRLVLLGDNTLPAKLDASAARALRSRITSRIRVGALDEQASILEPGRQPAVEGRGFSWSFTAAAAVSFAVISYATVLLMTSARDLGVVPIAGHEGAAPLSAAPSVAALPPGISGDEPYLATPLRIPTDSRWVTGSALFSPPVVAPPSQADTPPPPVEIARTRPPEPPPMPKVAAGPAAKPVPGDASSTGALSSKLDEHPAAKAPPTPTANIAPAKSAAPAESPTSSIAAFRTRFR